MNLFSSACYSWTPFRLILVIILQLWWNGLPSSLHFSFCLSPFGPCLSSLAFQHWKEHMFFLLVLQAYWIPHILVITSNRFVTVFCCQTLVVPMACKQCQRSGLRKKCRQKGFFYVHSATKNFLKSVGKMQVKLCKSMWLFVSHVLAPPTFVSTNCSTHTSLNGPIRNIHPMGPHLLLRESCMAMETGYIEYDSLPSQIRTGCIRTLKHGSQFCDEHPQNHKEIDKVGIRGKQKYRYNVTFLNIIQTLL